MSKAQRMLRKLQEQQEESGCVAPGATNLVTGIADAQNDSNLWFVSRDKLENTYWFRCFSRN
jgi:hypothetical protein